MPRVIKHPDIRRTELLDCAIALFLRRGYDNVSLNEVIAAVGASKGAFYNRFPSKDSLVAALAERTARAELAAVEDALAQCSGNALDRLNVLLQAAFDAKMNMGTPEQLAAMVSLLKPDNAYLYGRIVAIEENLLSPVLTRLISQGIAEGIFDTFDPEGVADMIYALAARTNSNILDIMHAADEPTRDHAIDLLTTRFKLHRMAIDRILGLPDGSITTLTHTQVETMVAALPRNY